MDTHFGYKKVTADEKSRRVKTVFQSVASRYDVMNDLMSLGMHRYWKWMTLQLAGIRPEMDVLDLACGSGDLLLAIADKKKKGGRLVGVDPSSNMLALARKRIIDAGFYGYIELAQSNAEELPFTEQTFDLITFSFGLRNTTDMEQSLRSCLRILKPGGRCLVLEFSKPVNAVLDTLYERFSFSVLPRLGQLVANDRESYQYLVESIRMHPDQQTLSAIMEQQGFSLVSCTNLSGGIVAIHSGYKV